MAINHLHQSILKTLQTTARPLTIDDIAGGFPGVDGGQVLLAVDSLSRRGLLLIKRHGFDYLCELSR